MLKKEDYISIGFLVAFAVMIVCLVLFSGNADAQSADPSIDRIVRAQESQADSQRRILDELVKIRRALEK